VSCLQKLDIKGCISKKSLRFVLDLSSYFYLWLYGRFTCRAVLSESRKFWKAFMFK